MQSFKNSAVKSDKFDRAATRKHTVVRQTYFKRGGGKIY